MNRSQALAIRKDRVRRARDFAGFTSQDKMAKAIKERLGGDFSTKIYISVEAGTRDFFLYEVEAFIELTGATIEFLTGASDVIELNRARGVQLSWPGLAMPRAVDLIAS